MPAYSVSICEVTNPHDKFKEYIVRSEKLLLAHGGEYLVKGPLTVNYSGEYLKGKAAVVVKFPSMEALRGFMECDEYVNEVAPLREGSGVYDIAIYEEFAGE